MASILKTGEYSVADRFPGSSGIASTRVIRGRPLRNSVAANRLIAWKGTPEIRLAVGGKTAGPKTSSFLFSINELFVPITLILVGIGSGPLSLLPIDGTALLVNVVVNTPPLKRDPQSAEY